MSGYQQEDYRDVDSSLLPLEPARNASGQPVTVSIDTRTGTLARTRVEARGRTEPRCCCSIPTSKATSPKIAT